MKWSPRTPAKGQASAGGSPLSCVKAKPPVAGVFHLPATKFGPWALGLLLAAATVLAYLPIWHAGFIWDDNYYVTANRLLTAPDGLRLIWFSLDSPSQYFPLTYTWFRLEHDLWGLNPAGYHGMNLLLHIINALLLWRLLKRLAVPGAWLGAAIFALHPVQVESVAWVSELKNVLMLFFYLPALLAWVEFIEQPAGQGRWYYLLSLVLYALALCAKTTACTLPVTLLLILWLRQKPIDGARLAQTLPFFVFGLGMGILAVWWERYHQGTEGKLFALTWLQRVLVAGHAFWFYLGKLVWPVKLTFMYPRWRINASGVSAYLWPLAAAALAGAVYVARRFLGRGVLVALIFFAATLAPVLGFIMYYTFRYTFVQDHYQYVACIGPMALASAGLFLACDSLRRRAAWAKTISSGTLLLTLGVLTWRQCGMYANAETLWRVTLARNPGCEMAHINLGNLLLRHGKLAEAVQQFKEALQLDPKDAEAESNLGGALARQGKFAEAIQHCQRALQLDPGKAGACNNLGYVFAAQGKWDEAVPWFEQALKLKPYDADTQVNLGVALAILGKSNEAIHHLERALQLHPDFAQAYYYLGVALAGQGKLDEAIPAFRQALKLATAQGNAALADSIRTRFQSYAPRLPQSRTQ